MKGDLRLPARPSAWRGRNVYLLLRNGRELSGFCYAVHEDQFKRPVTVAVDPENGQPARVVPYLSIIEAAELVT